jgi:hypothetical protein
VDGVPSGKKIWWTPLGHALALLGSSLPANAADLLVEVACPGWLPEARGQVEARLRVTILAEGLDARRIQISCEDGAVGISVESSTGSLIRPVQPGSAPIEDAVVTAVEAAMRELAGKSQGKQALAPAPPATEPAPAPATPARTPAFPRIKPTAPPAAAPASSDPPLTRPVSELYATPTVGLFKGRWALGGTLGVGVGTEALLYGLAIGGRTIASLPASFDATEWSAGARLAWSPTRAAGFRVMAGLGVSVLVTDPADDVVVRSSPSMLLSVAYLELQLSRPFFFGGFGVAPGLGVRLFSDHRKVRVNEKEQLALPLLTPEAMMSFVYRR